MAWLRPLDVVYALTAVLAAPVWMRKARGDWGGRFGKARVMDKAAAERPRVLLHAVSVGEVNALRGLVPLLAPHVEVVVSVGTDTGIERARALFADERDRKSAAYIGRERIVRYPVDFSFAVSRFLNAVKPDAVVLVELEVWPNFIKECAGRGVPVGVINGRLSARSFKGYQRLRRFLRPTFGRLAFAAVQNEAYAERFRAMGVAGERVTVTNSMKWDSVKIREPGEDVPGAKELAAVLGIDPDKPLVVAGSTGPLTCLGAGAEALFVKAGSRFVSGGRLRYDDDLGEEHLLHCIVPEGVQLLCAPRKPERFDAAFRHLGGEAQCERRTSATPPPPGTRTGIDRFLLDTIGELRAAYSLADVAIVGRSFGGLHGSDPIEPISLGVPTIIGPEHSDFADAVEAFRKAGAIEVVEPEGLAGVIEALLNDRGRRERMIEAGYRVIEEQRGATGRHAELILNMVGTREGQEPPIDPPGSIERDRASSAVRV